VVAGVGENVISASIKKAPKTQHTKLVCKASTTEAGVYSMDFTFITYSKLADLSSILRLENKVLFYEMKELGFNNVPLYAIHDVVMRNEILDRTIDWQAPRRYLLYTPIFDFYSFYF
jgi:hypothetical protein